MRIDILHTNDIHSHVDNFIKSADIIKKQREGNKNTLLIDAGDIITGEYQYSVFNGIVEREIINYLKYDVMALGNHDFDNGFAYLKSHMQQVKSNYVLSNVKDPLHQIGSYSSHLIKEIDNIKVGFVSFLLPYVETSIEARGMEGLNFLTLDKYRKDIDELRSKVDILIAVNHQGYERDIELANANLGIDIIIGAHSHTLLHEPTIVNGIPIVQAGSFNEYIGKISFNYHDNYISDFKAQVINLHDYIGEDHKVKTIIDKHLSKLDEKAKEVYATTATDLEGRREIMIERSTNLGTLVCDSYLHRASALNIDVDFAIVNARGLRQGITKGPINYRHLYNVMPFNKQLVVCELKGADLIAALSNRYEFQTANLGIHNTSDGRTFFDYRTGKTLENEQVYRLITVDYVYDHEAFSDLKKGKLITRKIGHDIEVVASYLKTLEKNFTYESNNLVSTKEK